MDEATIKEALVVERASSNILLKDVEADMNYWRTLLRFNREERITIRNKMAELETKEDQKKWNL